MDRLFRIDFYPQDWLVDTASLEPDECGLYIQIVMLIYAKRGPIEEDYSELSRRLKGLSMRKCKVIVASLIEKGFLSRVGTKLTQKRAENEIENKKKHLDQSSRGGTNSAQNRQKVARKSDENPVKHSRNIRETEGELNENNNLVSSPVPTPPRQRKNINPPTPQDPGDRDKGVFKNGFGGGEFFHVDYHLTDADRIAARQNAPQWDLQHLMGVYDEGINDGRRERPKMPGKAFAAWCKVYTKGRPP